MAVEAGEIVVRLKADIKELEENLKKASGGIGSFGTMTVAKGVLISDAVKSAARNIAKFAIDSVKAFGESEQAVTLLARAVGKDAAGALTKYATELQRTTTYSDEAIISLQTQLSNFGVLPGSIKTATKAVMDYAAATGKSLPEAAGVLGQAMSGQSRDLKRYGLILDENASRSENLARATGFMTSKFGGTAEQLKGTTIGSLENFKNRINDLQELIGKQMVPVLQTWGKWLDYAISKIEQLVGASRKDLTVKEEGIKKLREERDEIIQQAKLRAAAHDGVVRLSEEEQKRVHTLTRQINALKETKETQREVTRETKLATGAVEASKDAIQEKINALKRQIREERQVHQEIVQITNLEAQARVAAARNSFSAVASYSQAMAVRLAQDAQSWGTVFANTTFAIRDNFASSMADVIVEGGSFAERFKQIGQDILKYFIEEVIKKMVAHWLAGMAMMQGGSGGMPIMPGGAGGAPGGGIPGFLGGSPLGLLGTAGGIGAGMMIGNNIAGKDTSKGGAAVGSMAGAVIGNMILPGVGGLIGGALGGAVGGNIKKFGKQIKKRFSGGIVGEPSVVIGMNSGTMALAGEKGPEALVSFEDDLGINPNQARNRLMGMTTAGAGGGGGGITINISGMFLEGSPEKWQRMIRESIVPEIRRYTDISPKGSFIRRRGAS